MRTTKIGVSIFGVLLMIILIMWFGFDKAVPEGDCLSVESFAINGGYGYTISCNDKILIYQPFIPSIEGNQVFLCKEEALQIGNLVLERLRENTLPTVSREDLIRLGITF